MGRHSARWPLVITCVATLLALPCRGYAAGGLAVGGTRFADRVGVNAHLPGPDNPPDGAVLQRLHDAGVRLVRNDLTWATVERAAGVYDFITTGYDELVAAAEAQGLTLLFILDYGNPLHGPTQAVLDEEGRTAFAAFAVAAARRYGGRGHLWEIWNEPNLPQFWSGNGERPDPEQYARLVEAVVPALRAADPAGRILIGATFMGLPAVVPLIGGVEGVEFLQRLFATSALESVDGITAHFYRADPPETVGATVDAIRQAMAAAGHALPLWSGEWGYSTYDPDAPATGINYLPAVSLEQQASYVARMLLTNYALGLAGSVVYDDRDAPTPSPGNIEDHFGLLHDDLTPKPAYVAAATLLRLVGAATGAESLALDDGEHGLRFATDAGPIVALWSEQTALWHLVSGRHGAQVLSRDGRDVTPAGLDRGRQMRVRSVDGPIYLVGDIALLAPSRCAGDCTGDAHVTVDELIAGVRIALGGAPLVQCAVADADDDGVVTTDELVAAVGNALEGCAPTPR